MINAREEASGKPTVAPQPATHARSPILPLFLLWSVFAGASTLVLYLDASQPRGILLPTWRSPAAAVAGIALVAALSLGTLGFAATLSATGSGARAASLPAFLETHWRRALWFLIGAAMAGSLAVVWALRTFPNSGDEYDYLFQAKTFLAGRLWNPVPPLHELFAFNWQFFRDGKWTTIYPPGWPALLAATMALRLPPWLASPLAGGLLLFVLFRLGQRREGALGGVLAVFLVAVSPFFLFNAASYFMHVPAAAVGLLFCWAAVDFLDQPRPSRALFAGLALGALGLIRPEDVPLFAVPFAAEFLWRAGRQHYRFAPVLILAGLPFLTALLLYNHAITGSALPDLGKYEPQVRFGLFPVNVNGYHLTPLDQLRMLVYHLIMLGGWTSPLLVLGYVATFARAAVKRRLGFIDFIFPAYVLGYLLVPFLGGNSYGPRYYFEAFAPLVLTLVSGLAPLLRDTVHRRAAAFVALLVMAHGAFGLCGAVGEGIYLRAVVNKRMDLYDQVQAKGLHNAVVVIRSAAGRIDLMPPEDLTRNGIAIGGPVIYALDIPDKLQKLRELFPDRSFYIYERDIESPKGSLQRLR